MTFETMHVVLAYAHAVRTWYVVCYAVVSYALHGIASMDGMAWRAQSGKIAPAK